MGLRIKPVVLHHGMPEKADALRCRLAEEFDGVEIIDCGSSPDKMPSWVSVPLPNVYWQGAWIEAMNRWWDWDVIWMPGADIELLQPPKAYRMAMERAWPFGCWSPAIDGRAHPFMQASHYGDNFLCRVKNVEGMALAVSGPLIRSIGRKFKVDTKYGFGQDFWLCAKAREMGLPNYIGFCRVHHPPGIGYNEKEAHDLMEREFSKEYGHDFRRTLFEYGQSFRGNMFVSTEDNLMGTGKLKLVTVDNGWGVVEFERLTDKLPVDRVVMRKGVSDFSSDTQAKVIPYDEKLTELINADIAFFPKVGSANRSEFEALVEAGVPTVVHVDHHNGKIIHEQNGFVYQNESWAAHWLSQLVQDAELRKRVREKATRVPEVKDAAVSIEAPKADTPKLVTIITPTYRRDPRVVSRCIDCVRLQTVQAYEHLICSDGASEAPIEALVKSVNDNRLTYTFTTKKKAGDFGNVVRSEMLAKANGKYILFLDDDNLILPDYLEKMIKAIEDSKADFAVCRVVHFGPLREEAVGAAPQVLKGVPVKLHHIDTLQVLVKREAMQAVGWDTENGYLADGHTLEKLGSKYNHVVIPDVLGFHM